MVCRRSLYQLRCCPAACPGSDQGVRWPFNDPAATRNNTEIARLRAAAFACPTRSIRHTSGLLEPAGDPFPMRLDDQIYLCGHNSVQTAGARRRNDPPTPRLDDPNADTPTATPPPAGEETPVAPGRT